MKTQIEQIQMFEALHMQMSDTQTQIQNIWDAEAGLGFGQNTNINTNTITSHLKLHCTEDVEDRLGFGQNTNIFTNTITSNICCCVAQRIQRVGSALDKTQIQIQIQMMFEVALHRRCRGQTWLGTWAAASS